MNLQQWASNGWLRPHQTSPQEIQDLLAIVKRDLRDAQGDISADWRFGIAYNAALKLCTILLYASGSCLRTSNEPVCGGRKRWATSTFSADIASWPAAQAMSPSRASTV